MNTRSEGKGQDRVGLSIDTFCLLNSVLVREEALYRLKGDVYTRGKWLCDEVSPDGFFLHDNSDYI